jgi:hypothetical protein
MGQALLNDRLLMKDFCYLVVADQKTNKQLKERTKQWIQQVY